MERDQPLTPAGRLFVQPQMDQIINVAIAVDSPFSVDVAAVKAEVRSSVMLKLPRFCSLMVRDSCGREYWRRTEVDVDRHVIVRHHPLSDDPLVSDEDAVNDFIADLAVSSPLPADKPLWEIHILVAHATAVFRLHHAMGLLAAAVLESAASDGANIVGDGCISAAASSRMCRSCGKEESCVLLWGLN